MPNVVDYLKWRGDLSFSERPFNDVDNLVLSLLAYMGFDGIVFSERSKKTISLETACAKMIRRIKKDPSLVTGLSRVDATFLEALKDAPRFAEARLGNYVNQIDSDKNMQFAALTIYLPSEQRYVSYRGTDGTLVGWRENLDLSFKVTEADKRAALYLENCVREYLKDTPEPHDACILVGGHSKGGNLASYAASVLPKELLPYLDRVWSNDGPNMCPGTVSHTAHDVLGKKYIRLLPNFSVVGMIFNDAETPMTIVQSSENSVMAHDAVSWQVECDHFVTCSDFTSECKHINEAFTSWYTSLPLEYRESMTNDLFDALMAGGAVYFSDITSSSASLRAVLTALMNTDRRTWSVFADLFATLVSASASTFREQINFAQRFSQSTDSEKNKLPQRAHKRTGAH